MNGYRKALAEYPCASRTLLEERHVECSSGEPGVAAAEGLR